MKIKIIFGAEAKRNQTVKNWLDHYGIRFESLSYETFSQNDLMELFRLSTDCFVFLSQRFLEYKLNRRRKFSELMAEVMKAPDKNLRLPIALADGQIYADLQEEDLGVFIPKKARRENRKMIFLALDELDKAELFKKNLIGLIAESDETMISFQRQLFGNDKVAIKHFWDHLAQGHLPPREVREKINKILHCTDFDFTKSTEDRK